MAIKAINIFRKYSKKDGTFNLVEQEFNSTISLAEKRTILVALHNPFVVFFIRLMLLVR